MSEDELAAMEAQAAEEPGMHSGCTDYACYCHFNVPKLVAEVRRLRESRDRWKQMYLRQINATPRADKR